MKTKDLNDRAPRISIVTNDDHSLKAILCLLIVKNSVELLCACYFMVLCRG